MLRTGIQIKICQIHSLLVVWLDVLDRLWTPAGGRLCCDILGNFHSNCTTQRYTELPAVVIPKSVKHPQAVRPDHAVLAG